ncbi:hypothetical protein [Legionella brunensis]|uniref:Uncharacterized protein n=1 Tax=Legionella brunensis TaxID=29422 RepID=A0A0W0STG4_9GAMM|nr:hypothetical protein [Legionella brunensis]KTC86664.1 hypothetical protein Lbru_0605 [Legionella brunensis]
MEDKERVFAYQLAKTIDNEELDKVSGGSALMTSRQTVRATAGSGQGADVAYDVAFDW